MRSWIGEGQSGEPDFYVSQGTNTTHSVWPVGKRRAWPSCTAVITLAHSGSFVPCDAGWGATRDADPLSPGNDDCD